MAWNGQQSQTSQLLSKSKALPAAKKDFSSGAPSAPKCDSGNKYAWARPLGNMQTEFADNQA